MSTTIHSDKTVGVRPKYLALGVDRNGRWHTYRTTDETILVTDEAGLQHVERLDGRPVRHWVAYIDDGVGWQDHPDASPGRGWLEAVAA
jgi:hypothetical protein